MWPCAQVFMWKLWAHDSILPRYVVVYSPAVLTNSKALWQTLTGLRKAWACHTSRFALPFIQLKAPDHRHGFYYVLPVLPPYFTLILPVSTFLNNGGLLLNFRAGIFLLYAEICDVISKCSGGSWRTCTALSCGWPGNSHVEMKFSVYQTVVCSWKAKGKSWEACHLSFL
jgi:hypothetical protein